MSLSLNIWGEVLPGLVKVLSEYLVFVVMLLGFLVLIIEFYRHTPPRSTWALQLKALTSQALIIFALPVGLATFLSELISAVFVRQRPFVALHGIKLLIPHGADGGMPSHHMVFMFSVATMAFFMNNRAGLLLALLSIASGIARICAGIHYPSDVLAGILLGAGISVLYAKFALVKWNRSTLIREQIRARLQ